jgi:hypothetical protein
MTKIARLLRNPWVIAGGLLALTAITYGLLMTSMGLYWDDWPSLWFLKFFGPGIFPQAFASDRPLQGWLFVLTTSIFGQSLAAWQVFGILARWLSGIALGWLLISLWPEQKLQVLGVVTLFLVYPGFSQQYVAITYGHQFLIMSIFFLSLALMVWSIRKPAFFWLLTGASLLTGVLSMFALEYYFGLELLRPVFIWILLSHSFQGWRKRISETLKHWSPYLIADVLFIAWRVTHSTPRGEVTLFSNISADPFSALLNLARTIAGDIYESAILAWARIFSYLQFNGIKPNVMIAYAAVVLGAGFISIVLLLALKPSLDNKASTKLKQSWGLEALLVGVYALLISGWPIWVTDLHLELAIPWDRFTQPMILGACLAIVGLIDLLIRPYLSKIIFISLLVGLSAGTQFYYAMNYRQEWVDQRSFFWQLAWRAPAIEPGTLLLTNGLPFYSSTDNSLTAAINWIYAPDLASHEMPYLMYDMDARLGNRLPSVDPGVPIEQDYRATNFKGSTSQALVFFFSPPRCLKILDLYADRHYPNKSGLTALALPLSQLKMIQEAGPNDPQMPRFLGPELSHGWCYYFEKVDLNVQLKNWGQAVKFADQALKTKPQLTSDNAPELIPFIYAYNHAGQYEKAADLSRQASKLSKKMQYYICDTWFYLDRALNSDPAFEAKYKEIFQEFACDAP